MTSLVDDSASISVAEFYSGKSVFITGGTGYLGKVFTEKLLYSCPNINKIYVLIRNKKGVSADQRIQSITDCPIFTRLKEKRPQDLNKLIPIAGNISAPNLGIDPEDDITLVQEVSVVFHCAATVRFNEPLKVALNINLEGTQSVLKLCQRMKNIQAFVHVSTAFSNVYRYNIDEVVYPPIIELEDVYAFAKKYDGDEKQTKILLKKYKMPNTYTLTKHLAEHFIKEYRGNVPSVIIRPSIVTPAELEPIEGWIDNWYGATLILHYISKGYLRAFLGRDDVKLDVIPVDYVSNLTLVAAAKCHKSNLLKVYNACTSECNPITMKQLIDLYTKKSYESKFYDMPVPGLILYTKHTWLVKLITFFSMTLPTFFLNICLTLMGKPVRIMKIQMITVQKMFQYFTSHSWIMSATQTQDLHASLSLSDKALFPCDPANIEWTRYIPIYFNGVKRFLIENAKS